MRPNNWKNPHRAMENIPFADLFDAHMRQKSDDRYRAYEAGADAILEALKEEGKYTEGKAPTLSINVLPEQKGWLVFIPDKEAS